VYRETRHPAQAVRLQAVGACRSRAKSSLEPTVHPWQFTPAHRTLNVKFWTALGDTPLLALKVMLNCVPRVHQGGLPVRAPMPFSSLVNSTPGGRGPISERNGVGEPVVVTANELGIPAIKVTW